MIVDGVRVFVGKQTLGVNPFEILFMRSVLREKYTVDELTHNNA